MKKSLFVTILICYLCSSLHGQHVLRVNLQGIAPYDSLKCLIEGEGLKPQFYIGQYEPQSESWFFHLPDTTFDRYESVNFRGKYNTSSNITIFPGFRLTNENISMGNSNWLYWEDTDTLLLYAQHQERDTIKNNPFFRYKTVVLDNFVLVDPSPVLRESMQTMNLCYSKEVDGLKDEQLYRRLLEIVPRKNNSRMLLYYISQHRFRFSAERLDTLYSLLSENIQNSYSGKKLKEFIDFHHQKFEDTLLTNCRTGKKESIVTNDGKYTLLVFSASWCMPCHKLIPVLKDLYEKKKDIMDIVYVTLDTPEQLPAWKKLMKEQKISWRSLAAEQEMEKIRQQYKVLFIPYAYLIHPHKKKIENINIQTSEGKAKIEKLACPDNTL